MTEVFPCPLCGRSANRRGEPFDEPSKTKSHIDGAHDKKHAGERGDDHMSEIRANGEEVAEIEESEPADVDVDERVIDSVFQGEATVEEAVQSAEWNIEDLVDSVRALKVGQLALAEEMGKGAHAHHEMLEEAGMVHAEDVDDWS
jgi:hypothetical protein